MSNLVCDRCHREAIAGYLCDGCGKHVCDDCIVIRTGGKQVCKDCAYPLEEAAARRQLLYTQFRTQLRNLMLCYLHALTQSKYKLEFWENGAIKSISPPRRK